MGKMPSKDWDRLRKAAMEQGWRSKPTKKGELLIPPDPAKDAVALHGTPSDQRAFMNHLAEMKRQGLVWPWPPKRM
jgi:hypothetical protein